MKILYVISRPLEINTSASIRNRATILGLLENGHDVKILTTEPDENHPAYDPMMSLKGHAEIEYFKLGGIQHIAKLGRKMRFFAPLRKYIYRLMSKWDIYDNLKGICAHIDSVSLKEEKYDAIISSSDPKSSHLFVYELLKKQSNDFYGKWIQIWGDPFAGDITNTSSSKDNLIRKEELKLLSAADKIVYVSELTLEEQKLLYPNCMNKMYAYPIPFMKETLCQKRNLINATDISLVYCGDYSSKVRNIMPLYCAVKNRVDVKLTICGNSDLVLQPHSNITVCSRLSYDKVIELETASDILVHLSNLKGNQIPGKIYQLSATNKPILFIVDGDCEGIYQAFGKYNRYVFARNQESDILRAIDEIKNGKQKTDDIPVKDFSRQEIAMKILDSL